MGRRRATSERRDILACEGFPFDRFRIVTKKNTTLSIAVIRIYMVYQPGDQHLSTLIYSQTPPLTRKKVSSSAFTIESASPSIRLSTVNPCSRTC